MIVLFRNCVNFFGLVGIFWMKLWIMILILLLRFCRFLTVLFKYVFDSVFVINISFSGIKRIVRLYFCNLINNC